MNPFKLCPLIAILTIPSAQAETILSAGPSITQTRSNSGCSFCESYSLSERVAAPALSLEVRNAYVGLMASYGRADRESHAVVALGVNSHTTLPDPTQPRKDISQSITAQWFGLQGTTRYSLGAVTLRAQAGAAFIQGRNWERGTYDYGTGAQRVEHRNATTEIRPLYGLGLEYAIDPAWLLKLEWQHIPQAVQSYWTDSNRIDSVSVQLGSRF